MTPTPGAVPVFRLLAGLFEPSAIQQLPDGRFLVVEDEKDHSFSLVTLSASGNVSSKSLGPGWFHGGAPIWLNPTHEETAPGKRVRGRCFNRVKTISFQFILCQRLSSFTKTNGAFE